IILHFFLKQPMLAWPAALDPFILLLCVQPVKSSLLYASDFETSFSFLREIFTELTTLSDIYMEKLVKPETPLLGSFLARLEEWEGTFRNRFTDEKISQLIQNLKMHPEKADTYAKGKSMFLEMIAVGNRYMLLQAFFNGFNCTKALDKLYELNGTIRDIYTFALSQTKIGNYDDIIPYIECTPTSESQERSLAILIRWLKGASVPMLQNFASNVTGHDQKLGNKFKISFKTESQGEVSLQDLCPHFHSCFSRVDLYPWTFNLADVQLLEIFN